MSGIYNNNLSGKVSTTAYGLVAHSTATSQGSACASLLQVGLFALPALGVLPGREQPFNPSEYFQGPEANRKAYREAC